MITLEIERGAQNQHGLFGGTGSELDDGGSFSRGANHIGRVTLEDGLLGCGEVYSGSSVICSNSPSPQRHRTILAAIAWAVSKTINHLAGIVVQRREPVRN